MEMVDDIVKEFLVESYENLDQLDRDLMALEDAPDDRDRLSSVFRTIHTIKGTSGFLAYPKLEHIAHVGENLLVKLRDGVLRLNAEMTSCLLEMLDAVRSILGRIDNTGAEGDDSYADLVVKLEKLKSGEALAASPGSKPAATPSQQTEIEVERVVRELTAEVAAALETTPKKKRSRSSGKSKMKETPVSLVAVPVAQFAVAETPTVAQQTTNNKQQTTNSHPRLNWHYRQQKAATAIIRQRIRLFALM